MKFRILHLLVLGIPCLLSAQVNSGFNALDRERYEQAKSYFTFAYSTSEEQVAADFGLARYYEATQKSQGDLAEGWRHLQASQKTFEQMSKAEKAELERYKINTSSYRRLVKNLQQAAFNRARKQSSLLHLDTLLLQMKPIHTHLKNQVESLRSSLVLDALDSSPNYQTLTSLSRNHFELVFTNSFKHETEIRDKLLVAFLNDPEGGFKNLDNFVKDHPNNYFARDCWTSAFVGTVNNMRLAGLVDFSREYPHSMWRFLAQILIGNYTDKGKDLDALRKLSSEQRAYVNIMAIRWRMIDLVEQNMYALTERDIENLFRYLDQEAPGYNAFNTLKIVLQKLLDDHQWDMATDLLQRAKAYFPDFQPEDCDNSYYHYHAKQRWFEEVIPIVERPAEGITYRPTKAINTIDGDELSPVPTADGHQLYFSAVGRSDDNTDEDIFVAEYDFTNEEWLAPQLVGSLSTDANESPVAINFSGNELIIFRDGQLYSSRLGSQGWLTPEVLPPAINAFPWIGGASFSSDGNTLIFAASKTTQAMFEGSDIDLYFTQKDASGNWGIPTSLGRDVNTVEDDRSPYLYPDDKTLYFSSGGHQSLGDKDIYVSYRLDDSWTNWSIPVDLGKEVNSVDEDWGYIISMDPRREIAYSSRANPLNDLSDIYWSPLPSIAKPEEKIVALTGVGVGSPARTGASVIITDPQNGDVLAKLPLNADGTFNYPIPAHLDCVNYHIEGEEYFPQSRSICKQDIVNTPGIRDTLQLTRIEDMPITKVAIPLRNILFDYNKSDLKPESTPELERVYDVFKDKTWIIEIAGHTDNAGTPEYNEQLSLRRANAVRAYLIQLGISPKRLEAAGFGETQPIRTNETELGRKENRRVEIRVSYGE
ncbi:MAG: OmpA family protein [Bacteroidota bacterium]